MKIQLVDRNTELCNQWRERFKSIKGVSVHNCSMFDIPTECVVSPANSFGFMDGNLDLVISEHVGWDVQERLQSIIKKRYDGELLVGLAVLINTNHDTVKYVISAPTMRVPSDISNTVNVYLAAKAIFRIIKAGESLKTFSTVTISGLGTGCGQVPFNVCSRQMLQAYSEVMLDELPRIDNWVDAQMIDVIMRRP